MNTSTRQAQQFTPYPAADARAIAQAFLPPRWYGNRYDYYYALIKLRTDPLYPGVLAALRGTRAPLLDLGCGLGLLAHALHRDGQQLSYRGVDIDADKIRRAPQIAQRSALGDARFDVLDLGHGLPTHNGSVAILDVLQYLDHERQQALLSSVIEMLGQGAKLVIRSGLRDDSRRSRTTRLADRFANLTGWMQEVAKTYPTRDGLLNQLQGAGLRTSFQPLYGNTPFNNWLIVAER